MSREIGAGADTMATNLTKQREYDKILEKLKKEFAEIDVNRDGTITYEEVMNFLLNKVSNI